MNFGALRVLNDDLVKPRSGFGCVPVPFMHDHNITLNVPHDIPFARDSIQ